MNGEKKRHYKMRRFKCVICDRYFEVRAPDAKYCPDCREEHYKAMQQQYRERNRGIAKAKKNQGKKPDLKKFLKEKADFEKRTGRHLSYGEYYNMVHGG